MFRMRIKIGAISFAISQDKEGSKLCPRKSYLQWKLPNCMKIRPDYRNATYKSIWFKI